MTTKHTQTSPELLNEKPLKKTITSSSSNTVMSSDPQEQGNDFPLSNPAAMHDSHPIAKALDKSRTTRFQRRFERHLSKNQSPEERKKSQKQLDSLRLSVNKAIQDRIGSLKKEPSPERGFTWEALN